MLYVNTPYRAQADLPNFDSAPKDFNFDSIYADNPSPEWTAWPICTQSASAPPAAGSMPSG